MNNDGFLDLVMTHGGTNNYGFGEKVSVHLGNGAGNFNVPGIWFSAAPSPGAMELGDFASGKGIADLTGLEYCTNLLNLDLGGNLYISDISVLGDLTNLQTLDLHANQISDVSALTGLTNLWNLGLGSNQISDISALADLTNMKYLGLDSNQISDISPLVANVGIGGGDEIYLQGNPLSADSRDIYIPQLQARGVTVFYDAIAAGDANGDGTIDALDITSVERVIARLDALTAGADANQDGKINALDITKIERRIAGLD